MNRDPYFAVLLLAAGEGTRMRSLTPKVLHKLCEKTLIQRVLDSVSALKPGALAVVVGHGADQITRSLSDFQSLEFVRQKQQQGSGDAVRSAAEWLNKISAQAQTLLVLCGDTPLVSSATLRQLLQTHAQQKNSATVLSQRFENPFGYGRIVRNERNQVLRIVEQKDASEQEQKIQEINSGIYCFDLQKLLAALPRLKNQNAKKEFYLTDVIQILSGDGDAVNAMTLDPAAQQETLGVNSRNDLAQAEKIVQQKICAKWMAAGVTILNPDSVYIGEQAEIGPDTTLLPGSMILGKTKIGSGCSIGPNTFIQNCEIGSQVELRASFLYDSKINDQAKIGPFAHIRQNAEIGSGSRIGNFTEIKKSKTGQGVKISHLSYVGDAVVGDETNIGAGVITCNYDGQKKHATEIGANAFIGSNVNLVAPVKVGDGAIVGAGSTISKDVPKDALAIERSEQVIKEGWAKKRLK